MLNLKKLIVTGPSASFFFIKFIKKISLLLFFSIIFLASGCKSNNKDSSFTGVVMGTTYEVKVASSKEIDPDMAELINSKLQSMNKIFTTYDESSELMIFNDSPINVPQKVSMHMLEVLIAAKDVYIKSSGSFDPTVASLVNLWGFGPILADKKIPDKQAITDLLAATGMDKLQIDIKDKTATRLSDIKLDLSAIAKGYAADCVARLLDDFNIENYLIEVGGELRVRGKKLNGKKWNIAIEKPYFVQSEAQVIIQLIDSGVATSGNYRNFFKLNEKIYSHTIDPRNGYPIEHDLISATVIADSAAIADAFSTAMMVMGPKNAIELAKEYNLAVYLIIQNGDTFDTIFSENFKQYFIGE